jgi:transposase-like protein
VARWTREAKATAVARVEVGESVPAVAESIGTAASTLRRWVNASRRSETLDEKKLADDVEKIAERITVKQTEARELLLDKLVKLVPQTDDLMAIAKAYGIVTDKALLAAGKPTSIHGNTIAVPDDATADELAGVADELRRRRMENPVERTTERTREPAAS